MSAAGCGYAGGIFIGADALLQGITQKAIGIGHSDTQLSVFVIPFWVVWVTILAIFYFGNIPIGPGAGIYLRE